jgi:hypothetical protein
MSSRFITLAALLLAATPSAAQGGRTFSYGAGTATAGDAGLHITASLEASARPGALGRRLDVIVQDRSSRDVFVLANLVYAGPAGRYHPYALGGLGVYTGPEVPLAANVGFGVESTLLSSAPVFLEARLL